ncbi:head maturation protease, ClpP-related [Lysinibacillus irui]|uniref:head maturation protease, ClpP-related n=1 Tax=Lysinibacillus irui TaxID=2998077 RepID=UPI002AD43D59|nr:head maturation protease, ClpP-related [Lysinibacillus irui]MEA0565525.1 Clp protease ClpP [Lysinibacillus irui]
MKRIDIKGRIVADDHLEVYEWFGYAATSPSVVKSAIAEAEMTGEKELLIEINSGGGSVFAAAEIYYALKKFDGVVNVEIPSLAASAASFIAMAGHKVSMSILAQFMIHGASTFASGNHQDMTDTSDFLRSIDDSIINAYLTKTSKSREELRTMMDKDTWMTPQQALEYGFIDEILFENSQPNVVASVGNSDETEMLPQEVIDKVKAEILAKKNSSIPDPVNVTKPQMQNEEDNTMDLKTLQNNHPELFNQVKQMGHDEGVKAENDRIKAIEEIAPVGNDALVQAAKFDKPVTAEQLAVQIVKNQKEAGAAFYTNAQQDAEQLQDISGEQAPENQATSEQKFSAGLMNVWGGNKQ